MMLQRFHDTGRAYMWEFLDPLSDGSIGYARFRFSYASLLPEAAGRPVFFEGMSTPPGSCHSRRMLGHPGGLVVA